MQFSDEYFMNEALKEAQKAFDDGEVPVGAVVVSNQLVIARAHNLTERLNDSTAHAEMLAITAAENYLGGKYLSDCTLFVTLEPCLMCAGAIHWAQLGRVVWGAADPKRGFSAYTQHPFHPKTTITKNFKAAESAALLTSFFKDKRK